MAAMEISQATEQTHQQIKTQQAWWGGVTGSRAATAPTQSGQFSTKHVEMHKETAMWDSCTGQQPDNTSACGTQTSDSVVAKVATTSIRKELEEAS